LFTTVFLVRHARHALVDHVLVGRMAGVRLSDEGRREAAGLAAWFAGRNVAVVQSSPRRRARETAEPIAAALRTTVEIVPALDEIEFGQWTGCRFDDLARDPRWQAWNAARGTARPPGGETMIEAQARLIGHIEHLGRTLGRRRAVLVSHCDVIKAALLHVLGRPVDAYGEIEVAPASVSTIEIGSSGPGVAAVNAPVAVSEWRMW
jgi:broad specificity phosphatase PhoE